MPTLKAGSFRSSRWIWNDAQPIVTRDPLDPLWIVISWIGPSSLVGVLSVKQSISTQQMKMGSLKVPRIAWDVAKMFL
jgi:hypothetical protein